MRKTGYFLCRIFPAEKNHSRFGLILGGRVYKKAVERNRGRRMIYGWFRDNEPQLPAGDYLVTALPALSRLTKEEMIKALKNAVSF